MSWTTRYSQIDGVPECIAAFNKLGGTFDGLGLEVELLDCAGIVRDNVRMLAPMGPTGNLKNSIVAKTFMRQNADQPAAFVAIDYRFGPHAHLVEFGTTDRYIKANLKTWKARKAGTSRWGYRGHMPAKPFFRPGVDMSRGMVMMRLKAYMQEQIKRRANSLNASRVRVAA